MDSLWRSDIFLKHSAYVFIHNSFNDLGVIINQKEGEFHRAFKDKTWRYAHLGNPNHFKSFSDFFKEKN